MALRVWAVALCLGALRPLLAVAAEQPAAAPAPQRVAEMRREIAEKRISRATLHDLLGVTPELITTAAARLSVLQTVLLSEAFHVPADSIAALRWGHYPAAPGSPLAGVVFLTLWPAGADAAACRVITADSLGMLRSR